jgi:hypothetical protein
MNMDKPTPRLFGPVTNREQLGWQRRSVRVLDALLERAQHEGLPVMGWSVAHAGTGLVGHCFAHDSAQQRAAFDAWCAALNATRWAERTSGSTTHLHAVAKPYQDVAYVALMADLCNDQDEQDDQDEQEAAT